MRVPGWAIRALVGLWVSVLAGAGVALGALDRSEAGSNVPFGIALTTGEIKRTPSNEKRIAQYESERAAAVRKLLDDRADAILHRKKDLFLAGIDATNAAFLKRQRRLFGALAEVPLSSWRYEIDHKHAYRPSNIKWEHYAGDVYLPSLTLKYAIRGFDVAPVARPIVYTIVQRGGQWLLAEDKDLESGDFVIGATAVHDPWDVSDITVVAGERSLVLGEPKDRKRLVEIASMTDAAIEDVSRVLPTGWSRKAVVYAPRDEKLLEYLLNTQEFDIAAVAIRQFPEVYGQFSSVDDDDVRTVGSRVIIHPDIGDEPMEYVSLVLRHEITHVATFPFMKWGTPQWVVEGFAEYVAYRGFLPSRGMLPEIAQLARTNALVPLPPFDLDFTRGAEKAVHDRAYTMSWLACAYVSSEFGEARLLALVRELSKLDDPTKGLSSFDPSLRKAVGITEKQFTRGWHSFLRQRLG